MDSVIRHCFQIRRGAGIAGTKIAILYYRRAWCPRKPFTYSHRRRAIRKSTVNLLGAAALVAAGLALLRQGNDRLEPAEAKADKLPPGEKVPTDIRLEKLRELGI